MDVQTTRHLTLQGAMGFNQEQRPAVKRVLGIILAIGFIVYFFIEHPMRGSAPVSAAERAKTIRELTSLTPPGAILVSLRGWSDAPWRSSYRFFADYRIEAHQSDVVRRFFDEKFQNSEWQPCPEGLMDFRARYRKGDEVVSLDLPLFGEYQSYTIYFDGASNDSCSRLRI